MTAFGDYYDTLTRMRDKLELMKAEGPFTIITNREVRRGSQTGNSLITPTGNDVKNLMEYHKDMVDQFGLKLSEYQYITAFDWIKEWKIIEDLPNILILTDGEKQVQTGDLTYQ